MSFISRFLYLALSIVLALACSFAFPAAAQVAERIHIPTIVNFYPNSGVSKGDQKVKDAIKEANRILKANGADMQMIIVKEIDPQTGGDAGSDGEISQADSAKEMKDISRVGVDEVKKFKNKTGFKLSFAKDCWKERPGVQGWNYPSDAMTCIEGGLTAAEIGHVLVHELSHYLRGSRAHSGGANDVTSSNAQNGDNIPANFLAEMKKKSNRRKACKCNTQFDTEFPGVRDKLQRGTGVDEREDQDSPEYVDIVVSRLLSEDLDDDIDGYLTLDSNFSGLVDAFFVFNFDTDGNPATGFTDGPFAGMEKAVDLHVSGDAGVYSITGVVFDHATATSTPLDQTPLIVVGVIHDENFDAPDSENVQLQFQVRKSVLGLPIAFSSGSDQADISVGVYSETDSVVNDDDSFIFEMDSWLRDALLQSFGNGVPTPGAAYPIHIEGLKPNDTFVLYLDEDAMATVDGSMNPSNLTSPTGTFDGSFEFPVTSSRAEPHFLVAQDTDGEIAYGMTCPKVAGSLLEDSTLELRLGALPQIEITSAPGSLVQLGNLPEGHPFSGHVVGVDNSVWSTVNFGPGTSLFTGVPLISNLFLSARNEAGLLQSGHSISSNQLGGGGSLGPFLGGPLSLSGQIVILSLGGSITLPVPLSHVGGQMGETTMVTLIGNNITATNGPFITGSLVITAITSNIVTIPARANVQGVGFSLQPTPDETMMTLSTNGGFVSVSGGLAIENRTVTIDGTNNLASGSMPGSFTVVAPLRVALGAIAGNIPASVSLRFSFVPEPGMMLLLVFGAAGLAVAGRRRMGNRNPRGE